MNASKCRACLNSYYILLVAKPKCIQNQYASNKTMKILLIFKFFHYIWFISENLPFTYTLKEKNDKVSLQRWRRVIGIMRYYNKLLFSALTFQMESENYQKAWDKIKFFISICRKHWVPNQAILNVVLGSKLSAEVKITLPIQFHT